MSTPREWRYILDIDGGLNLTKFKTLSLQSVKNDIGKVTLTLPRVEECAQALLAAMTRPAGDLKVRREVRVWSMDANWDPIPTETFYITDSQGASSGFGDISFTGEDVGHWLKDEILPYVFPGESVYLPTGAVTLDVLFNAILGRLQLHGYYLDVQFIYTTAMPQVFVDITPDGQTMADVFNVYAALKLINWDPQEDFSGRRVVFSAYDDAILDLSETVTLTNAVVLEEEATFSSEGIGTDILFIGKYYDTAVRRDNLAYAALNEGVTDPTKMRRKVIKVQSDLLPTQTAVNDYADRAFQLYTATTPVVQVSGMRVGYNNTPTPNSDFRVGNVVLFALQEGDNFQKLQIQRIDMVISNDGLDCTWSAQGGRPMREIIPLRSGDPLQSAPDTTPPAVLPETPANPDVPNPGGTGGGGDGTGGPPPGYDYVPTGPGGRNRLTSYDQVIEWREDGDFTDTRLQTTYVEASEAIDTNRVRGLQGELILETDPNHQGVKLYQTGGVIAENSGGTADIGLQEMGGDAIAFHDIYIPLGDKWYSLAQALTDLGIGPLAGGGGGGDLPDPTPGYSITPTTVSGGRDWVFTVVWPGVPEGTIIYPVVDFEDLSTSGQADEGHVYDANGSAKLYVHASALVAGSRQIQAKRMDTGELSPAVTITVTAESNDGSSVSPSSAYAGSDKTFVLTWPNLPDGTNCVLYWDGDLVEGTDSQSTDGAVASTVPASLMTVRSHSIWWRRTDTNEVSSPQSISVTADPGGIGAGGHF